MTARTPRHPEGAPARLRRMKPRQRFYLMTEVWFATLCTQKMKWNLIFTYDMEVYVYCIYIHIYCIYEYIYI